MQDIAADLAAPFVGGLFSLEFPDLLFLLLDLQLIQPGLQDLQSLFPVLDLASFRLAGGHDACGLVHHADGAVGLVDVLTAGSTGPFGFHDQVLGLDLDFDFVIELRHDVQAGKGCVTPGPCVKGRDPHQAVHAFFSLEIPVGFVAFHQHGHALDAGFFPRLVVQDRDFVALAFGIAGIHPVQHPRPVAGLRPAGTRMQFQDGVGAVIFMGKQDLDLEFLHTLRSPGIFFLCHFHELFIEVILEHRSRFGQAVILFLKRLIGIHDVLQPVALADDTLGLFLVAPEIRLHGRIIQASDLLFLGRQIQRLSKGCQFFLICGEILSQFIQFHITYHLPGLRTVFLLLPA